MNSRVCQICNIKLPLLLGPMAQISRAPLVAAVSEAGGLGCLDSANMSEQDFRDQVRLIRDLTKYPFAINIAWPTPNAEDMVRWSVEERIEIVISSAGLSESGLEKIQSAGIVTFQVIANVVQAVKAEALGVDAVIAKGFESGGLNGVDPVATFPLIPQVVDAVSIPVIAAGGIGDGRGLAAAIALGAEGVLLGTRFLATSECPIYDSYKHALVNATETDTIMIGFSKFSVRVLKNSRAIELRNAHISDIPAWDIVKQVGRGVDCEKELLAAGQVAGLIKTCSSVKEIVERLVHEFNSAVRRLQDVASL